LTCNFVSGDGILLNIFNSR